MSGFRRTCEGVEGRGPSTSRVAPNSRRFLPLTYASQSVDHDHALPGDLERVGIESRFV